MTFGRPDEHAGFARVAWTTQWNNGQPAPAGDDFAQFAPDGRIRLLVSFDGALTSESPTGLRFELVVWTQAKAQNRLIWDS